MNRSGRRLGRTAIAALTLCLTITPLARAAASQPNARITRFTATPTHLGYLGGNVAVVIRVSNAVKCELRSAPASRHTLDPKCSSKIKVTLPENYGATSRSYALRLTALTKTKQKTTKTIHVSVARFPSVPTGSGSSGSTTSPKFGYATALASMYHGNCAVLSSGGVVCWGSNRYGALGNGASPADVYAEPVKVEGVSEAVGIASDGDGLCALLSTGGAMCWGWDNDGALGDGDPATLSAGNSSVPVSVSGLTDAVSIVGSSTGYGTAPDAYCALRSLGGVMCWGDNSFGDLGNGGSETYSDIPVEVAGISNATDLATDGAGFCAVLSTGTLQCWGDNADGALGDGGTESYSAVPVTVLSGATSVTSDDQGYCALLRSGGAECWGQNFGSGGATTLDGQLGDGGSEEYSNVPVVVKGLSGATSLTNDFNGVCALLASGGAECWGVDIDAGCSSGCGDTLGDGGSEKYSNVPVNVSGLSGATSLWSNTAGYCAVLTTGDVSCWGGAYFHAPALAVASPISGLTARVIAMTSDVFGYCTLLTTGGVMCWGDNSTGELGAGLQINGFANGGSYTTYSTEPVLVVGLGS